MGRKDKRPTKAVHPSPTGKVPRGASADQSATQFFNWNLDGLDMDGPFGWHLPEVRTLLMEVFPKLKEMETITWARIPDTGSHSIEVSEISKDDRDRLIYIGKGEFDSLYSIRLSGRMRIFGIKDRALLRILWWDPDHKVCPSNLRGT